MTITSIEISIDNRTNKEVRLGDIREWMKQVDKFNLPNDHLIHDCNLAVYFEVPEQNIIPSECMECSPQQHNHDVLITTHQCVNPYNTLAHAYDQAL